MARLVVAAALLGALLPGVARGGACSPLDCSPSQFTLAHGTLLALRLSTDRPVRVVDLRSGATRWRLPPGIVSGHTLVHQDGALLTWYDLATGARLRDALLQQHGTFQLVGASQDGRTAVLARTEHRSTTFALVSDARRRIVRLGGRGWAFDALNGGKLFLVHYLKGGYEIRWLDGGNGPLGALASRDRLWGSPWSRTSSADGRYLFTLYVGPNGAAMVHVLDTLHASARCVDLPGTGSWDDGTTYALVVDPDGRHLWAISTGYGRVVRIDVPSRRVVDAYRIHVDAWNTNFTTAVMSPDGERIAFTDANHIWFLELARRRVVAGPSHTAIALAYSPDEKHLWVLGQRSRVSPLPVR
jgi:hypothetical protein